MYLLDTNIVSEARRGTPQAVSWLRLVDPLSVHLSALTLGEIMRGIALNKSLTREPPLTLPSGCASYAGTTAIVSCR